METLLECQTLAREGRRQVVPKDAGRRLNSKRRTRFRTPVAICVRYHCREDLQVGLC